MKQLARRIEEMFIEIAFAEERQSRFPENISVRFTERLDDLFTAITFAELGEFDTAQDFMGGGSGDNGGPAEYSLPGFCAGRA